MTQSETVTRRSVREMNVVTKYLQLRVAAENWTMWLRIVIALLPIAASFVSSNAHADEAFARFMREVMRRTQNPELDVSTVPTGTAPGNPILDDINRKPVRFDVY